jgi:hypothetical protein
VKSIKFYIFNQDTGVLTAIINVPESEITRGSFDISNLHDGTYTFVAWGDSDKDLSQSYTPVQMVDAENNTYTSVSIGKTTISNFYMVLLCDPLPSEIEGDIIPAVNDFDDLYYAKIENVTIKGGIATAPPFSFVSNSNMLNIRFTGLENLPDETEEVESEGVTRGDTDLPFNVFVLGRNGRYNADNKIDLYAQAVRYEPQFLGYDVDKTWVALIKTMRFDLARHLIDPVMLYIQNDEGEDLCAPIDILRAILQIEDPETQDLIYVDQAAIDRQSEFRVEIDFKNPEAPSKYPIAITLTINGWEVILLDPVVEYDR